MAVILILIIFGDDSMDLILLNGKIVTMDKDIPQAQAVAVKEGLIVKVGSNYDVLALQDNTTKVIDLDGKLLLPGFNDSHMHLLNYGLSLNTADLSQADSIDSLIHKVKSFIAAKNIDSKDWILGNGWNQDYFSEKRLPTKYDLDEISKTLPICLLRACGHISVVNSKALQLLKIDNATPQVHGGSFDIDENGEILGIFRENALKLIYDRLPEPGIEEIKSVIIEGAKDALKCGITSVQSDDFGALPGKNYERIMKAYCELAEEKLLPVRVYEQCLLPEIALLSEFLDKGYHTGWGDEWFKLGPLKLLNDGSLGARTALLCEPYSDDSSTSGIAIFNQEELDELVCMAHENGMQVAVHGIGDKAMYMIFESIEKAHNIKDITKSRSGVIHCQITDKTLIEKFKQFNSIAYVQPIFIDYDMHIVESRIGNERMKNSYIWKGFLNRGIHVAFGSDCPVEPFNVLRGIYCAVTRKDLKCFPEGGWMSTEKVSVYEAVHAFTLGASYASFEEDMKGSITEGKLADMVVLSEDIFETSPEAIKDVSVVMTFVDGECAYALA